MNPVYIILVLTLVHLVHSRIRSSPFDLSKNEVEIGEYDDNYEYSPTTPMSARDDVDKVSTYSLNQKNGSEKMDTDQTDPVKFEADSTDYIINQGIKKIVSNSYGTNLDNHIIVSNNQVTLPSIDNTIPDISRAATRDYVTEKGIRNGDLLGADLSDDMTEQEGEKTDLNSYSVGLGSQTAGLESQTPGSEVDKTSSESDKIYSKGDTTAPDDYVTEPNIFKTGNTLSRVRRYYEHEYTPYHGYVPGAWMGVHVIEAGRQVTWAGRNAKGAAKHVKLAAKAVKIAGKNARGAGKQALGAGNNKYKKNNWEKWPGANAKNAGKDCLNSGKEATLLAKGLGKLAGQGTRHLGKDAGQKARSAGRNLKTSIDPRKYYYLSTPKYRL